MRKTMAILLIVNHNFLLELQTVIANGLRGVSGHNARELAVVELDIETVPNLLKKLVEQFVPVKPSRMNPADYRNAVRRLINKTT